MMRRFHFIFLVILFLNVDIAGAANPTIEDFGLLPAYRAFSISPDGKHYAYIQRKGENDYFVVVNASTNTLVGLFDCAKFKARRTQFVTNNHVILIASETKRKIRLWGQVGAVWCDGL